MMRTRRAIVTILSLICLVLTAGGGIGMAHGGGTVRAEWEGNGFHMVIETNEAPNAGVFGGTVHVTLIPTSPGGDRTVRLRHLDIHVTGRGPGGQTSGPIRAKQMLNGPYEADLVVRKPGRWVFGIEVGQGEGAQYFEFPLDVEPRTIWADLGVVGGLLLIPVLALYGMVRVAKRRQEEEAAQSSSSPGATEEQPSQA